MISVSPSRLACFFECPKKYDYVYNQELVPIKKEVQRKFDKGNYTHELLHAYYQLIQSGTLPGSDLAVASITRRIQSDIERNPDPALLPTYAIVTKQVIRYITKKSPEIDQQMEVLGVEYELCLPVTNEYELFGYGDLLFRRQNSDRIRDHKTGEKALSNLDARNSNQLLYYGVIWYKLTGVVPVAEINYINTHDYKSPRPDSDLFAHHLVTYTQRELEIYFEMICKVIEKMLHSEPLPAYGRQCNYCPYQEPCYLERKGADSTPVIQAKFKRASRGKRHATFTDSHSPDDESDSTLYSPV